MMEAWRARLEGTEARAFARLAQCMAHLDERSDGARCWSADASRGSGGSAPKLWIAAPPNVFADVYLRIEGDKHAYEVLADGRSRSCAGRRR